MRRRLVVHSNLTRYRKRGKLDRHLSPEPARDLSVEDETLRQLQMQQQRDSIEQMDEPAPQVGSARHRRAV
jgi:hypothetical protein